MTTLVDKWDEIAREFRARETAIKRGEIITCAFSPYEVVVSPDEAEKIAIALRECEKRGSSYDEAM